MSTDFLLLAWVPCACEWLCVCVCVCVCMSVCVCVHVRVIIACTPLFEGDQKTLKPCSDERYYEDRFSDNFS